MTRRDRLRGRRFQLGPGLEAEIRRSCRNELKIVYEAQAFSRSVWERLATLGRAEVFEASRLNPAMRDLFRVACPGMLLEGAVEAGVLTALFRGPGRLGARHRLQQVLREAFDPGR